MDIAELIDTENQVFIDKNKERLSNLDGFSTDALEWLMMEHFQFSNANVNFLTKAANQTANFDTDGVNEELIRNCNEENGHAIIYRSALKNVGCDVEERSEFAATTEFLGSMDNLMDQDPSTVLGSVFAGEAAAVFESEVFLEISKEVIERRDWGDQGRKLVGFHELHLSGVEQAHRDELGIFLKGITTDTQIAEKDGERPTIDTHKAMAGARETIVAMDAWWDNLMAEVNSRSKESRAVA